jgi:hypothetical protein
MKIPQLRPWAFLAALVALSIFAGVLIVQVALGDHSVRTGSMLIAAIAGLFALAGIRPPWTLPGSRSQP